MKSDFRSCEASATGTNVMVIGAGPTGLLLAAELVRRKVKVRIIDKRERRQEVSKALVVQARTLEIMELCGLIDPFLRRGYPAPGLAIGLNGGSGTAIDLQRLNTRYPYLLIIPQNDTEEIIEHRLNELGVSIERGIELRGLREDPNGVTAMIRVRGRDEEIQFDYLIGCDGTHSAVREMSGIPFEGENLGYTTFLADVKLDAHFIRSRITNFTGRRGFVSVLPFMGDYARIFAVDFEKQHIADKEPLDLSDLQETVDAILPKQVGLHDPRWITRFRSPSSIVPTMRRGRIFLAGDAAHSHSPAGGQGMNSGLQDAYNLAWRLAFVCHGFSPETLLDGYNDERLPVNSRIQRETDTMFRSFVLENPLLKAGRDILLGFLLPFSPIQRELGQSLSNIGVDYIFTERSRTERNCDDASSHGLSAGSRVPDAELWRPGEPYLRLYEVLRRPILSLFAYVTAERLDAERNLIQSLMEDLKEKHADRLARTIVLDEGLPEEVKVSADVLVDHKGQFASQLGAVHGSVFLMRPDGYLAFHRAGWAHEKIIPGVESWLFTTSEAAVTPPDLRAVPSGGEPESLGDR